MNQSRNSAPGTQTSESLALAQRGVRKTGEKSPVFRTMPLQNPVQSDFKADDDSDELVAVSASIVAICNWCGRGDSNPHALAGASPSSWCVCQFRHFRKRLTRAPWRLRTGGQGGPRLLRDRRRRGRSRCRRRRCLRRRDRCLRCWSRHRGCRPCRCAL
jgi:hypothetical protein